MTGISRIPVITDATVALFVIALFAVTPSDTHALTLQNDLFVKQHLPDSVLYSGSTNRLDGTITAVLIHPDGTTKTVSEIYVTDQGLYASGFHLYKYYPVGEYTIKVVDDSEDKLAKFQIKRLEPNTTPITSQCFYCTGGGTVTRIVDAFTLDIDTTRIRLALIDGAKQGQPGYEDAVSFTASMCPVGTTALFDADANQGGVYGIVVAEVFCSGTSLNQELLRNNHADIVGSLCSTSKFALTWGADTCIHYSNQPNANLAEVLQGLGKPNNNNNNNNNSNNNNKTGQELSKISDGKTIPDTITSYVLGHGNDANNHNHNHNHNTRNPALNPHDAPHDAIIPPNHTMIHTATTPNISSTPNPFDPHNPSITQAQIIILVTVTTIACITISARKRNYPNLKFAS